MIYYTFDQLYCILLYFVKRLYVIIWKKQNVSVKCLVGKTAIVTGSSSGIGYATAVTLASRGCKVILADCVDQKTEDKIIETTGNKDITFYHIDLSSLRSVRNFAAEICKKEDKIDILINNAGIGVTKKTVSEDGLNYLMQVNVFGAFLLTHLLIEPLKKSGSARVLFTSSMAAIIHNLKLKNLNKTDFEMNDIYRERLYCNSKACNILVAQEFAKKLERYGITVNSVEPYVVKTPILKNVEDFDSAIVKMAIACVVFTAKDALDVAADFLCVITKNNPRRTNGLHFVLSSVGDKPWIFNDQKYCKDMWAAMEDLVKLKPEERIIQKNSC